MRTRVVLLVLAFRIMCLGGGRAVAADDQKFQGISGSGIGQDGTGTSTAADDVVPVSNGSVWQAKAIPNCADSSGNHLNYTAASNAFSCGTSSSSTSGASLALDNLVSVAINTSLLAQTGVDLGGTAKPFRDVYIFGSGTYGTTYLKLTGTPTGTRTVTVPDATGTLSMIGQTETFSGAKHFGTTTTIATATIFGPGTAGSPIMGMYGDDGTSFQTSGNAWVWGLPSANNWIFAEYADRLFNFAHASQTDPTIFVHSHNQSTTQWMKLTHDGTDGVIDVGTGVIKFNQSIRVLGSGLIYSNTSFPLWAQANGVWSIGCTNTTCAATSAGFAYAASSGPIGLAASGITAPDTFFTRRAAATFGFGADNSASPVAQTVQGQGSRAGTDTDVAGGNIGYGPGPGTGAGVGAKIELLRNIVTTTGTTGQTQVGGFVLCETKTLSNTTATTTALATIASANGSGGCAEWTASVVATDATNFDAESQTCNACWVNKAGTFTISGAGTPVCTASVAASNSGSTTVGDTVTAAANVVSIKVTPVFTTLAPTTVTGYISIRNNSPGAVTCQ